MCICNTVQYVLYYSNIQFCKLNSVELGEKEPLPAREVSSLTWLNVFPEDPELWIILESDQTALFDDVYLSKRAGFNTVRNNRIEQETTVKDEETHSFDVAEV